MGTALETIHIRLNYPIDQVKEPVLYRLIMDYNLVPNILRANIEVHAGGTIDLELTGDRAALDRGLKWLDTTGVSVVTL
jgi:hypothetical protein